MGNIYSFQLFSCEEKRIPMAEASTEVWSYPTQSVVESFRFAFGTGLPGRIAEFIQAGHHFTGSYWDPDQIITMHHRTTVVSNRELWSTMLDPELGCC